MHSRPAAAAAARTLISGAGQASDTFPASAKIILDPLADDRNRRGHHVDAGRPSAGEVCEHYRLIDDPELHVALSWTVVVPDDGADPQRSAGQH
jgi:hypothetical protein